MRLRKRVGKNNHRNYVIRLILKIRHLKILKNLLVRMRRLLKRIKVIRRRKIKVTRRSRIKMTKNRKAKVIRNKKTRRTRIRKVK